jgi:undecaprenyl-diphosphatase
MKTAKARLILAAACALAAAPLSAQAVQPAFSAATEADMIPPRAPMTAIQAAVLGAIEGVTEFLPVSSTGHLLIAQKLMGMADTPRSKEASDAYAICIQLGAILAVLLISSARVRGMARGMIGRDKKGLRLLANLAIAFVPAALIGFLFESRLKQYLFDPRSIAIAWVIGGVFILLAMRKKGSEGGLTVDDMTWRHALIVGLAQIFALWPGVSRSLSTMAAGMLLGMGVSAAVEFSFLLGLVTLGAATLYEGIKLGPEIIAFFGWMDPLIGLLAAGVTAFFAVKWMIAYLTKRSPAIFGWYRIAIGILAAALAFKGIL